VGDKQLPHSGPLGDRPGILGREMHLAFASATSVDVGLTEKQVGATGDVEEPVARPAVPGVGEDPPLTLGTQTVGLDVVFDGVGGEEQVTVPGRVSVVQRPEVEDPAQEPASGRPKNPARRWAMWLGA
jgi:hypothetical protein